MTKNATVSEFDFLRAVAAVQPADGLTGPEATIARIHEEVAKKHPEVRLTEVGRVRNLATDAGLITKSGYNHRLTRKGQKTLYKNEISTT